MDDEHDKGQIYAIPIARPPTTTHLVTYEAREDRNIGFLPMYGLPKRLWSVLSHKPTTATRRSPTAT